MADDLSPQLKIQQQINEVLVARTGLLTSHTKILVTQLDLVVKIRNALKGEGLKEAEKAVRNVSGALTEATKKQEESASAAKASAEAQKALTKKMKDQEQAAENLQKGLKGLGKGISSANKTTWSFATGIFNVGASLGKLGIAILSVPFKMFDALADVAESLPRTTALADALEDVRDALGDIGTSSGKAVASQLKTIRAESSNLAGTGLNLTRTFGFGAEGLAGALKAVTDLATAAGESFTRLKSVFKASGLQLAMMQKGLGVTSESMAQMMNLAEIRGEDVTETLTDFSRSVLQSGKTFGIDVKAMAHGMAELTTDIGTFGHLGPKAFAPMVAYAKKLGLEVKQLAGTMAKFSGFSDTAQAASQLNQAFGMNVDSMKLMSAQNPAAKIDMLRKSFFAAGKDLSKMTYQQRQYLSQTTGLEGANLEAAFAIDKQNTSYENLEKQSKLAAKNQMSQQKVMKEMGKNIKKLNHLLQRDKVTGYFDAFIKGFGVGLLKAQDMREVLHKLRKSFDIIFVMGRRVGRMFVKVFPGAQEILKVFKDLLDPSRVQRFADLGVKAFEKLFRGGTVSDFFDDITDTFNRVFGGGNAINMLSKGLDKFTEAAGKILGQAFGKLTEYAIQGITELISMITNPNAITGFDQLGVFAGNLLEPIYQSLKDNAPALGDALLDLLGIAFDKVEPYLVKAAGWLAAVWFTKFGLSILGQGLAFITKTTIKMLLQALVTKAAAALSMAPPVPAQDGSDPASLGKYVGSVVDAFKKISYKDIVKAGVILFAIVASLGAGLAAVAGMFSYIIPMYEGISASAVSAFSVTFGVITVALVSLSMAAALIAGISKFVGPKGMAIAVIVIEALGWVMTQLSLLITVALAGLSAILDESTAKKMIMVAKAFSAFTEGLVNVGKAVALFAVSILNPLTLIATVASMSAITLILVEKLPKMIKNIMDTTKGINPDELVKKIRAVRDLAAALHPLVEIVSVLGSTVEEMADEDYTSDEISKVLDKMSESFKTILDSLDGFVKSMISASKGLKPSEISSLSVVGPLFTAAGTLIGAVMKPFSELMEASRDRSWLMGKAEELDAEALAENAASLKDAMTVMMPAIKALVGKEGVIFDMIEAMRDITLDESQLKGMSMMIKIIESSINMARFFLDKLAFTTKHTSSTGKVTTEVQPLVQLGDTLSDISEVLFSKERGFITKVIKGFMSDSMGLKPGDEKKVEARAKMIDAIFKPVKSIIDIIRDIPAEILSDQTGPGMFERIQSLLFGNGSGSLATLLKSLKDELIGVKISKKELGVMKKLSPFLTNVSTLFVALSKMGGKRIDMGKVSENIGAFISLLGPGTGATPDGQSSNKKHGTIYSLARAIGKMGDKGSIAQTLQDAPFMKTTRNIKNLTGMITSISTLFEKMGDSGAGRSSVATFTKDLTAISTMLATADGAFDPASLEKVKATVKTLKFDGGKLKVSHNIIGTKIELHLSLDSKQLGHAIAAVDFGKTAGKSASAYEKSYVAITKEPTKFA